MKEIASGRKGCSVVSVENNKVDLRVKREKEGEDDLKMMRSERRRELTRFLRSKSWE